MEADNIRIVEEWTEFWALPRKMDLRLSVSHLQSLLTAVTPQLGVKSLPYWIPYQLAGRANLHQSFRTNADLKPTVRPSAVHRSVLSRSTGATSLATDFLIPNFGCSSSLLEIPFYGFVMSTIATPLMGNCILITFVMDIAQVQPLDSPRELG